MRTGFVEKMPLVLFSRARNAAKNLLICLCVLPQFYSLGASIERNVFIDAGVGVPQFVFFQGQAMLDRNWQLGFAYGFIPGLSAIATGVSLPRQTVTLTGGETLNLSPKMDAGYNTWLPFIRWYPRSDNFYVQFSFTMLRGSAQVRGDLVDSVLGTTVGNVSGTASVMQPLPMLSVGHIFTGKIYYLNIMIGMSFFFMGASSDVTLNTFIPDALGGNAGNQAAVQSLQNGITAAVDNATAELKSRFPVLPSLSLSFGIML